MHPAIDTQAGQAGDDTAALWRAFGASRDAAVRDRLITCHLRFARIMAAKMYAGRGHSQVEFEDYLQYARIGLMEAVDRFDAARDIKFETYAASRINGAILTGLSSFSEIQEQIVARKRIVAARVDTLGAGAAAPGPDPNDPEALFGYLAQMAIGLAVGFALDDSGMYLGAEAAYRDNTYASVELKQLRERVKTLLETLPGNQRKVISYHYLQHIAFEEIAGMLSLSKGRIAQLHREALAALRLGLGERGRLHWSF